MLGHLPEILIVAVIGLLVFGPKRVIEMGSSLGKALREFQQATKDMNLSNLLTGEENTPSPSNPSTLSRLSQISQSLTSETTVPTETTSANTIVEIERSPDQVN